jgi:hypothetical protein
MSIRVLMAITILATSQLFAEEPPAPPLDNQEGPADFVPLPAIRPADGTPDKTPVEGAPKPIDGADPIVLMAETATVKACAPATFSLYGPEYFLRGASGHYSVTDELGRQICRVPLEVKDLLYTEGKPRTLQVSVANPLAQQHTLRVSLMGVDGKQVELDAKFRVIKSEAWDGWIVLTSIPPTSGNWADLRALGIHGALQYRMHPVRREAIRKGGVPFYVENVVRQQLSRYHTEAGLWEKTIAGMAAGGTSSLARDPSLCSRTFAETFAREVKRHAEAFAGEAPLYYSLAAEPSVTRLAAAADFDFSPDAIREFQRWLERDVYGTLQALNTAWGTQFKTWTEVVPMTTDEARTRLRDEVLNFGPWVDFRTFQDFTFSKVLRAGGDVLRQTDARAKLGITGAMGPFAFGGWDYSQLAPALDVIESYDIGCARALWRDLAPGKPALAMLPLITGRDDPQKAVAEMQRAIWRLGLEGAPRGLLLWDEKPAEDRNESLLLGPGGLPTALADAIAPTLKELDAGAGRLLANCERQHDGIAILYSPASIRVTWLLEAQQLHGDKWLQAWGADTTGERRESAQLRLRESWTKLLDDLGLGWRFVSSRQLEDKLLSRPESKIKVVILPRTLALSDAEIAALKQFVDEGGKVIADAACGRFDEHGKLRAHPALDDLFTVDTGAEPLLAEAMNPLDSVRSVTAIAAIDAALGADWRNHLPPVFSDEPKLTSRERNCLLDYRGSPVCIFAKPGVYLNLDVSDYLRWRLHPDQPRAQVTRVLLEHLAFKEIRAASSIDWEKTRLPAGTQLTWLKPKGAPEGSHLLALRRNPQERLHELGREGDGNWSMEKPERFTLVLRQPRHLSLLRPADNPAPGVTERYEGELQPNTPVIIALAAAAPQPASVACMPASTAGETVEVKINAAAGQGGCFYDIRVIAPDNAERTYYNGKQFAADGATVFAIPFARNDAPGKWTIVVRDVCVPPQTRCEVELKGAEK